MMQALRVAGSAGIGGELRDGQGMGTAGETYRARDTCLPYQSYMVAGGVAVGASELFNCGSGKLQD